MRAKHLTLLVAIFAIITMMFVSCNSEVAENSAISEPGKELVYASFVDKGAKELSFSYDVPAYDTLYWRYSAVKKDSYGTVGQTWAGGTAEEAFAPIPTDASEPTQGLAGKVGPFSQGKWEFKLQAFRSCDLINNTLVFSDQVFEGTATNVVLNKNQTNYIAVTVTPAGNTGKIKISDAYYEWASSANAGTAQVKLVVTLVGRPDGSNSTDPVTYTYTEVLTKETSENKYKFNGVGGHIAIPVSTTEVTTEIPAGVYTATFKVVENTDTPTIDEFAIQAFSLKVYGGLETIISGNLTEGLSYENYFSVPEQTIASTTANSTGAAEMSVDMTPASTTSETMKTIVVFPENSLSSNTQHTLSVEVTNIETAETQFDITTKTSNEEAAVAAIGLNLTKTTVTTDETTGEVTDTTTEKVQDFNGQYVTIKTFIQSGLTGTVTVMYDGDGEQPRADASKSRGSEGCNIAATLAADEGLGYNPATGYLSFETNHFSEFYVKTNVEALNVSSGRYYPSLASALDAALDGQTIKILKDIDLGTTGLVISGKDITLDLNGASVFGRVNGKLITIAEAASACIIDSSNPSTGHIYNTDISGQGHDAVCNYGSLTINGGEFGNSATNRGAGFRNLGTATINGGLFHGYKISDGYAYAIITGDDDVDAVLTINDAKVRGTANGGIAHNAGTMVINNADVLIENTDGYYAVWVTNNGTQTNVEINDGKFYGTKYGLYADVDDDQTDSSNVNIRLNGGVFSGTEYGAVAKGNKGVHEWGMSITGGLYSSDPSAYVVDGYVAKVEQIESVDWWVVKAAVAQIGEVKYCSLADAVKAVPSDGTETTIKMINNTVIVGNAGVTIPTNKNVVLDLNGFTVKNAVNENKASQVINNEGELKIQDSSDSGTGLITNAVQEGTQPGEWWSTPQYNYATNVIKNSGILNVVSGKICQTAGGSICYAIDNNSTSRNVTATISGGTVCDEVGTAVRMFCNSIINENNLVMTGGEIRTPGKAALWIQLPGSSATSMKKASLNISGGKISGGTYAFYDYSYGDGWDNVAYTVSGGVFEGIVESVKNGGNYKFIKGGTFDHDPSDYVATGYVANPTSDSTWIVEPVPAPVDAFASVTLNASGDIYYFTTTSDWYKLYENPLYTSGNYTIKMLKNYTYTAGSTPISLICFDGSDIVFDLNGKTLTVDTDINAAINTDDGFSDLTIKNGTIQYAYYYMGSVDLFHYLAKECSRTVENSVTLIGFINN